MYTRSGQSWLKHIDFIALDVLSAQLALIVAYSIRFGFDKFVYSEEIYRTLAVWMSFFCVLIAVMFNTMHDVLKRRRIHEVRQTAIQCLSVFGTIVIYMFSVKDAEKYSRMVLWLTLALYFVFGIALRTLWKRVVRKRLSGERGRAMLLVADSGCVRQTIRQFKDHPLEKIDLCGLVLVDKETNEESVDGVPVVSNLEDAAGYICREWIDEVYVAVSDMGLIPIDLMEKCREMGVTQHLQMISLGSGRQTVEKIAGMPVVTDSINVAEPFQIMLKRMMDIAGGMILLPFALLSMIIFGPIIQWQSPGPVLYAQERIGQNGRKFKMYKIRSMYMDADERKQELMDQNRIADGLMFKLDFDPRIIGNRVLPDGTRKTGVGDFIRRYSIDETAQCFNLLLGNMSLVGTRPPTVDEWERYELHHRARLATKPGITGMWQVQGRSKITDFEEITSLDTEYIANWDIGLDLRILLRTIWVVLQRKGAM